MDILNDMFGGAPKSTNETQQVEEPTVDTADTEDTVNTDTAVEDTAVTEPTAEAVDTTQEESKVRNDNGHMVPLSEYLNTRDQLKELKKFKEQVEAERRAAEEQAARNQYVPTPESSPYEIAVWQQTEMQKAIQQERINTSMLYAEEKYGPDLVTEAAQWAVQKARSGPDGLYFEAQIEQQRDPIGWVVKEYQKEQKVNAVLSDEEAFFRANAEKYGFVPASSVQTQVNEPVSTTQPNIVTQPKTTKLPGSSINNMTSAAGARESGTMNAIDQLFKK